MPTSKTSKNEQKKQLSDLEVAILVIQGYFLALKLSHLIFETIIEISEGKDEK